MPGLECGLIGEKYPGMDMISYGPTLRGVHSPDERLEIRTVEKFWELTLEILKSIYSLLMCSFAHFTHVLIKKTLPRDAKIQRT